MPVAYLCIPYCVTALKPVHMLSLRVLAPALLALSLASCARQDDNSLKLKGSDTVLPIAQQLAETYTNATPLADVSVTGGGSGVGIAALMENTTDIAMASRDIKLGEKLRLKAHNTPFEKVAIAYDALAVVVHPSNPLKQLTREQLELIYTGKVKNWKEVGGPDLEIVVYSRESSSGTHEFFKEKVMDGREFAPDVLMMSATGAVIQSVSQTPGAIGYVGLAYLNSSVQALAVSYDQGKTYVVPTLANALNKTYPIVRPLFFLYLTEKQKRVQPFLDYVFSATGQDMVRREGFIPVTTDSTLTAKPA